MTSSSRKIAIAVIISGNGSNLQALIDAVKAGLSVDIKVVISNQVDAYGLVRAQQAAIPTHVVDHRGYESRAAFDAAVARVIDQYQVDWILLAGFMRRLTESFVRRYAGSIINIHPSLLPKHKGLHTHKEVLAAGDKVHGVSVHFVTDELDGGPVICYALFNVKSEDNIESLKCGVQELEHRLYPCVLSWLAESRVMCEDHKVVLDGKILPTKGLDLSFV